MPADTADNADKTEGAGSAAEADTGDGTVDGPHTVLVTGAGGSGRTTVAAATACAAAGLGHRVLLVSPEPAARLAALLGHEAPERAGSADEPGVPRAVPGIPGLWLLRVDAGQEFRTRAVQLQERGKAALDLLGAVPLDEDELTQLPGTAGPALLHALRTAHRGGTGYADGAGSAHGAEAPDGFDGFDGVDIVVADLPPLPDGLNLLVLPEQTRRWLTRLVPPERQTARSLRPVLAQLAGAPMPAQWLYETTTRWSGELAGTERVLGAPRTVVRLVTEPGPLAADELRTALAGARLHGLRLESVIVNRLVPAGSADSWLSGLSGRQQETLARLREECAALDVPLCELPHLGRDPRGADDLTALARAARSAAAHGVEPGPPPRTGRVYAAADDVPQGWVEDRLAEDGLLVWHLPLPGAVREELQLVRRGEVLTVGVGPYRRVLPLPAALRRCRVSGAGLTDGTLRVRFTPDPQLWPRTDGTGS
ncbi:hypothetical protein DEH18_08585 [Streptomyces sp. NHF165]|uniref:ArsA family ATPase n=1 Tax=Streptomyces sp. NHF165 TaxID=2175864 RepID=UPI00132EA117|nr:ArsA-related P-loop ATPase [Streptomyces sp. NHF165]QHF93909.1 hypothetical protein DEH18_08585 [Streptomyces sp. NHF165]